ncbi:MAG: hypothetical protein RI601_04570 [Desulfurivibrionaceae bacterium]|nr:hypothetical protein [Desulfurivibrionaceae bacterium]
MATLPPLFLEATLHGAEKHGIETHSLAGNQGLLLFAEGITPSEQYTLLKKIIADLQPADPTSPVPQAEEMEKTVSTAATQTMDCQVSVEERAQLFKFLTG